jgi:phosphotransferase system  glucose/maltose/N-acetylglucosamine-specific IIC component
MHLEDNQLKRFLYGVEAVGAALIGVFLSVYLLGLRNLPKDVVYHSEPVFRTILSALGVALIVLVIIAVVFSFVLRKKD